MKKTKKLEEIASSPIDSKKLDKILSILKPNKSYVSATVGVKNGKDVTVKGLYREYDPQTAGGVINISGVFVIVDYIKKLYIVK